VPLVCSLFNISLSSSDLDGRMLKEVIAVSFKLLFRNSLEATEETHKNLRIFNVLAEIRICCLPNTLSSFITFSF
jgi:hypothetical protein